MWLQLNVVIFGLLSLRYFRWFRRPSFFNVQWPLCARNCSQFIYYFNERAIGEKPINYKVIYANVHHYHTPISLREREIVLRRKQWTTACELSFIVGRFRACSNTNNNDKSCNWNGKTWKMLCLSSVYPNEKMFNFHVEQNCVLFSPFSASSSTLFYRKSNTVSFGGDNMKLIENSLKHTKLTNALIRITVSSMFFVLKSPFVQVNEFLVWIRLKECWSGENFPSNQWILLFKTSQSRLIWHSTEMADQITMVVCHTHAINETVFCR